MHSIKRDASHPGSARGRDALPVDAVSTIEQLREVRLARRRAEAREFELAAHFADLHSKPSTGRALPGCEQSLPLGCDGTPPVAEFAALELSTALGIRPVEASALMAAALDVRHRLPWVWRSTMAAEVPVWQARNLADLVRELDWDAAHLVDLELSQTLPGMPWSRAEAMVRGLVLATCTSTGPSSDAGRRCRTGVSGSPRRTTGWPGSAPGSTPRRRPTWRRASTCWPASSARVAPPGGRDALRACALGLLATPARALQLMQASPGPPVRHHHGGSGAAAAPRPARGAPHRHHSCRRHRPCSSGDGHQPSDAAADGARRMAA